MACNHEGPHKYERIKLGNKGFEVFKCMLRDCAHWIRKELVVGRETICWRCGDALVMTKFTATMKKPHCKKCTRPYNKKEEGENAA